MISGPENGGPASHFHGSANPCPVYLHVISLIWRIKRSANRLLIFFFKLCNVNVNRLERAKICTDVGHFLSLTAFRKFPLNVEMHQQIIGENGNQFVRQKGKTQRGLSPLRHFNPTLSLNMFRNSAWSHPYCFPGGLLLTEYVGTMTATSEGEDASISLSKRRIVKYFKQAKARFSCFCTASHSMLSIVPSWVAINNVKKVGHWNPPLFYIKITLRSNTTKQGRLAPPRVHMLISKQTSIIPTFSPGQSSYVYV